VKNSAMDFHFAFESSQDPIINNSLEKPLTFFVPAILCACALLCGVCVCAWLGVVEVIIDSLRSSVRAEVFQLE
jgi:hypothetical protein